MWVVLGLIGHISTTNIALGFISSVLNEQLVIGWRKGSNPMVNATVTERVATNLFAVWFFEYMLSGLL